MTIKDSNPRDNEKSFRNGLILRAAIFSVLIIAGLVMSTWANAAALTGGHGQDSNRGFFSSFGIALSAVGAVRLARTIRCIRSPEGFQKAYTEHIDERNRFVIMKTYYTAAYIFMILLAAAIVVTSFMHTDITYVLSVCMSVFALILTVTYRVMDKRY